MNSSIPQTKTDRLLQSFKSVDLLPVHRNYGDQTRCLRDYGIGGTAATMLIRWGETEDLVCTFTNERGKGPNAHSWKDEFIKAAVEKHLELFGEVGKNDLPEAMLKLVGLTHDLSRLPTFSVEVRYRTNSGCNTKLFPDIRATDFTEAIDKATNAVRHRRGVIKIDGGNAVMVADAQSPQPFESSCSQVLAIQKSRASRP